MNKYIQKQDKVLKENDEEIQKLNQQLENATVETANQKLQVDKQKKRKRLADVKGIDVIKRQSGVINTLQEQLAQKDAIISDLHSKHDDGFETADDGQQFCLQAEVKADNNTVHWSDDEYAVGGWGLSQDMLQIAWEGGCFYTAFSRA